ncbi:uncharacterized protein with HEPN domain [Paraburkholderia eburnea]|uniref:Uncharacterized protein with HEPN domain n=1 Tax=Paraburkholderia eburnea TaxID=1189126 RepID=A0A2S4MN24_9BURK|nr:DUF86 domain-containing protein [Paraburkholderia eburnea]POR55757.1 uncharacterized protein with HEPN domain [Paraburkholderia eburnea]PRZ26885.1 uncharacterized protein with HEPN domain [Paraburkholderia eburnea]
MRKEDLRTPDYLQHMLDAAERIRSYLAPLSQESFEATPMAIDAVARNLEIIGEAARNIMRGDPAFTSTHPEIPWEAMYGMRNRISHAYFSVDTSIVWSTAQTWVPDLVRKLLPLTSK